MTAMALYAGQKSANFDPKLEASLELLRQAQKDYSTHTITQASSLGAEDMVVTELVASRWLKLPCFCA